MQAFQPGQVQQDRAVDGESGLTLIEVLVAMAIFMIIATGIAGTITVGLRGTVNARLASMAKTLAQQQIEEMRARPYYVPYSSDPTVGTTSDVDLLDVYYPNLNSAHHLDARGWDTWYTNSGGDAYYSNVSPIDDNGMQVTVQTRFVSSNNDVIVPLYSYNSNTAGADTPPSNLVRVVVTVSWPFHDNVGSTVLTSQISATGQSVAVSGVGGGGGNDCQHASNSDADIYGVLVTSYSGTSDPFTTLADGNMGEAHAQTSYGCSTDMLASGIAGDVTVNGTVYRGANASVNQNSPGSDNQGPVTTSPPATFPKPSMTGTYAKAEVDNSSMEAQAGGGATVGTQALQLAGVDGTPSDTDKNYLKWDFLNPVVTAIGNHNLDDGEDLDAQLEQDNGETQGKAEASYQQITMMPLSAYPAGTTANASATQGLVFVRNLTIDAEAAANGQPGGESTPTRLSYSATVGMFNPNKTGCGSSGDADACYDLYGISPANPLSKAIPLLTDPTTQSTYALQYALVGEWGSLSTTDIANAMNYSADGTSAKVAVDAVMRFSFDYGTELRVKTPNNQASLIGQAGYQEILLGRVSVNITQKH